MFALTDADLRGRILGCGDGPASFNASAAQRGARVVSVDPIYAFSPDAIRQPVLDTAPVIAEQVRNNPSEFVWTLFANADQLVSARLRTMDLFLDDLPRAKGHYVAGALPDLPFSDGAFDLALCSHFLFLYSEQHDFDFHLRAIHELLRVAHEVRIFPLMELGAVLSRHLDKVIATLETEGLAVSRARVDYEVQRGADQMLRLAPPGPRV
jgi:SAM-dependent methyltransferase